MSGSDERATILVVDDESHIVHVVSLKLRNAGYRVVTAADGEEGLEAALREAPDLVITDYQMPVMSGLELCEGLRKHEATARTPALMLTARGFGLSDEALAGARVSGVLTKPFSPREVLGEVQRLIGEGAEVKT